MSSWVEKPGNLFARSNLLPNPGDTFGEKLNALTRLLIVIVIVLVVLKWKYWNIILIVGIFLIIFFYLLKSEPDIIENFNEDMTDPRHYIVEPSKQACPCKRTPQILTQPVTRTVPEILSPSVDEDYSAIPLEDLCTYVKCEGEEISPQVPEMVQKQEAPVSRIRRPKTGVTVRPPKYQKERTAYENLQDSYDFVRKKGPKEMDYNGVVNIL